MGGVKIINILARNLFQTRKSTLLLFFFFVFSELCFCVSFLYLIHLLENKFGKKNRTRNLPSRIEQR